MIDPRVCNRFIQRRVELAKSQDMLQSLLQLQDMLTSKSITAEQASTLLNSLDQTRKEQILDADQRCRNLRIGSIPWTPQLSVCLLRIQYYRLTIKKMKDPTNINSRTLLSLRKKSNIQSAPRNIKDAQQQMNLQYKEFFEYKKKASNLRFSHLEQLAAATSTQNNSSYSSTLKQLRIRESIRTSFRQIKRYMGQTRVGLYKVEVNNNNNQTQFITDKESIETICMEENIR
jgi:hypothetical protein